MGSPAHAYLRFVAIVLLDPLPVVAFGKEEPERLASYSQYYAASHDRRYGQQRPVFRDRKHQNVSDWINASTSDSSPPPVIVSQRSPRSSPPPPPPPASIHEQTNDSVEPALPTSRPQSLQADEPAHEQTGLDSSIAPVQPGMSKRS